MTPREEFLQKMYEQMFRDIEQQISTVWQSVATVFGSFAIVALAEKGVVPFEFGISIVALLCGWFMMTVNECSYWYNRNLVIIANIERQFLTKNDLIDTVYYFGSHRPRNKMISQLQIQIKLGVSLLGLVVVYHFWTRIVPGMSVVSYDIDPLLALPYLVSVAVLVALGLQIRARNGDYAEMLSQSPGRAVDSAHIKFGSAHGH